MIAKRKGDAVLQLLADGELAVIISLRVAAIAGLMAVVACTPVMAQTTGTISAPTIILGGTFVAAANDEPILVE